MPAALREPQRARRAVAAQVRGMSIVVSEDSVRRALKAVSDVEAERGMCDALMHSVRQALDRPWVLECDRDRCACENGLDELKIQCGWGGFGTHDTKRSQLTARAVALTCNGWSWYVRAANPAARREAITRWPLLLAAMGRSTNHGGETTLCLTPLHAETGLIKSMIANVRAAIAHVRAIAEQLPGGAALAGFAGLHLRPHHRLNRLADASVGVAGKGLLLFLAS